MRTKAVRFDVSYQLSERTEVGDHLLELFAGVLAS